MWTLISKIEINYMRSILILFFVLSALADINAYPIDGYAYTGIDRLMYHYRMYLDSQQREKMKPGELLMMNDIKLSLMGQDLNLPKEENGKLKSELNRLFGYLEKEYSISVLDISDPNALKYAGMREHLQYQPGSVGKIAIAIAIFSELNQIYGNDWETIRGILYSKVVKGGPWSVPNHHTVPFYDVNKDKYSKRHVVPSDEFTLYEWLDHMLSLSSSAAASVLWREAVLMHVFDRNYECINYSEGEAFFERESKSLLNDIAVDVVNCPLREMGIGDDEWRLGSFFTTGADRIIPGKGGSTGTTKGLLKFLLALEGGKVVNDRSSLEIKRLMYVTDRRIRYSAARAIRDDAVYFKSGSYYSFLDRPGTVRAKYTGTKFNYMNSVAIVEKQDSTKKKYMVALMSNVLGKNSVNEHYRLAAQIDDVIQGM